ncbi:hypothetical protein BD324DRAFT_619460 [Kockovaella imperatae]|uniref:Dystroglycan-type cadherin-like domain-containing protein n=1 Tax=Kockovaella imperatae TaxID=4999 RepID=A0A1Y1UMU5_9TREE|nr:hypothetical protein BD324DRAFT_619460 [Kockovaella imperatae]ORX39378.1 hypothetical protein BD324DRAFT_619460 [Kockovaella imperatae]
MSLLLLGPCLDQVHQTTVEMSEESLATLRCSTTRFQTFPPHSPRRSTQSVMSRQVALATWGKRSSTDSKVCETRLTDGDRAKACPWRKKAPMLRGAMEAVCIKTEALEQYPGMQLIRHVGARRRGSRAPSSPDILRLSQRFEKCWLASIVDNNMQLQYLCSQVSSSHNDLNTVLTMLWLLAGLFLRDVGAQTFVPTARVDQDFTWITDVQSASNLPSWLHFNNGTLMGRPTMADVGSFVVNLGTPVTIQVTPRPGPVIVSDPIVNQLHSPTITSCFPYSANSSHYPGARVPPGWSFSMGFEPNTFTAPTRVFYQAALSDGSPLPAWLSFNNQTVTFDGVAPIASQSYNITVAGSDTFGCADIFQSFNLVVASHDLEVSPVSLNLTSGVWSSTSVPIDATLDGEPIDVDLTIGSIPGLTYVPTNKSFVGVPQGDSIAVPISIEDKYGDIANTTLFMDFSPYAFTSPTLGPFLVNETFSIDLGPYLKSQADLNATFKPASPWVSLKGLSLQGTVPSNVTHSVEVDLQATDPNTHAISTAVVTLWPPPEAIKARRPGLSKAVRIVLGVIGASIGVLIILMLALILHRRKKEKELESQLTTPSMEYDEKMPPSAQVLIKHDTWKRFVNPFQTTPRSMPAISPPVIMPSFANAAYQAQLAAAIDQAGIVKRGGAYEYPDTPNPDARSSEHETTDSHFHGHSSRASWESEAPFVWAAADRSSPVSPPRAQSEMARSSTPSSPRSVRTSDPPITSPSAIALAVSTSKDDELSSSALGSTYLANVIDTIHFPTESELSASSEDAIISTASRIDTRRSPDSFHSRIPVRRVSPTIVNTQSRLVNLENEKSVSTRDASQTAVSDFASLHAFPSLPSLPMPVHRILLGVAEPFHFYPPLRTSNTSSTTSSDSKPQGLPGATYEAVSDDMPEWIHFDDLELWGVPEAAGVWNIKVLEKTETGQRIVGRFEIEVVGR